MSEKPITYEDKMKYRDNGFLYDKCVKQYHQLMLSQDKNREYKNIIANLQQENERLKTEYALVADRNNDYRRTKEYYKSIVGKIIDYAKDLRLYDNESLEFKISNDLLEIIEGGDENDKNKDK